MSNESLKQKLTAILSADVKDYTRLMGQDEVYTTRTLTTHSEAIGNLAQQHSGCLVNIKVEGIPFLRLRNGIL